MTHEALKENGTAPISLRLGKGFQINANLPHDFDYDQPPSEFLEYFRASLEKSEKKLEKPPTRLKSNGRFRPIKEYERMLIERKVQLEAVKRALKLLDHEESGEIRVFEDVLTDGTSRIVGFQIVYSN